MTVTARYKALSVLAIAVASYFGHPDDEAGAEQPGQVLTEADGSVVAPTDGTPSASEISSIATSCTPGGLGLSVRSITTGPYSAQTTAVYDVAVTDQDVGPCDSELLLFTGGTVPANFSRFVSPGFALATPGQTEHFIVSLTGSTDAGAGDYEYPFTVFQPDSTDSVSGQLEYVLSPSTGCFVQPSRELFITDLSVVEDPVRTTFEGAPDDPRTGAWTFGHLAEMAAPTVATAPAFVERMFDTWLTDQSINGFTVAARPLMQGFLLGRWPRLANGDLDLRRAPLRLLGIVNRIDLRSIANGHAGQGRFVFGVPDAAGLANPFTVIVEFRLPAARAEDALDWAHAWHELATAPFPSETYNARLQAITDRFTARGADPRAINKSALAAVRTDEFVLAAPWELRQFALSPLDGFMAPAPVDQTPDLGFMGTAALAAFINQNEDAILSGKYAVPLRLGGQPFRGGSALNNMQPWDAPGILLPGARQQFSVNACNGCHSIPETGTNFVHVEPRNAGSPSVLSGFLRGVTVPDPVSGELTTYNDLLRRKDDLEQLVCVCDSARCASVVHGTYRLH